VLIVEDDDFARRTLSIILEAEGHATAAVANGREALAYLQRLPLPGLIVLDLMMPVMDGWEFCRRRARDAQLAAIPVVVISGTNPAPPGWGPPVGVVGYLSKPFLIEDLLRMIERC
jgi:CheY-like chemotaxis protein